MSELALPSDRILVTDGWVRVGDFDSLYRDQYARMVRLAFVLVDTQEEAEEVAQDAFAAVLPRFARLASPEAYLRGHWPGCAWR